ncbi:hypothetical protein HHS34_005460 [Acidithiobacillus montserratensis]|uniref:Uncharacterized protein n=1 Tax=Acidithiobacillus montserratensis TaxID=2729135 RepID=A0ACD5HI97_9PROT|nr:hypothetical protein [Acidithiobacillus montserratensis]MBU2749207.1 hypothetical protein [Acidithiobacillus montserratensis]
MLPPPALRDVMPHENGASREHSVYALPVMSTSSLLDIDGYENLGPVTVVNRALYTGETLYHQPEDTFQLLQKRLVEMAADAAVSVRLVPLQGDQGMVAYGTALRKEAF